MNESGHTFQVDLRGLVDLLSHHLYSSPRVYLRELMQNAVDAITARRLADPGAPARITITTGRPGGGLTVRDTGIGLTESDVHTFLATIGRSSKRTEDGALDLTAARQDFIGQFGIGLLACFVVADEIVVVTRSAKEAGAPAVEWRGHSDGTYSIRTLPPETVSEPGTMVTLTPRSEGSEWLEPANVLQLARQFGSLLRYEVSVVDKHGVEAVVNDTPPVWERSYGSPMARRQALAGYGERTFGFAPLDTVDLDIPLVGLRGVAFVLPTPVNPSRRAGHRVHLKGMLLSDQAAELVPDWAFFVACVVDTSGLRPTASREALYEDETLAAVRDAIGDRIRDWLVGIAASDLALLRRFVDVHHLAVKALARYDDQLLKLLLPWLPFETSDGTVSLDEFTRTHSSVIVTQTTEEFRQVAPIAAAAGLGIVNGGYVYDHELVHRLPDIRPGVAVMNLDPDVLGSLPVTAADGGDAPVTVGVRMTVPSRLAGNGIGRPAAGWDLDLQLPPPGPDGAGDLRLGDLVAVTDVDARWNMGYRKDWVTVGVVAHGTSPLPGHGPGITPILTGPAGALQPRPDPAGHVGLTAAMLKLQ